MPTVLGHAGGHARLSMNEINARSQTDRTILIIVYATEHPIRKRYAGRPRAANFDFGAKSVRSLVAIRQNELSC